MSTTAYPVNDKPAERCEYFLTDEDGTEHLTVLLPGCAPIPVAGDHVFYKELRDGVVKGTMSIEEIREKLDITDSVAKRFERISDRVTVRNGRLYFDNDEFHGSLAEHILRCLDAGITDVGPLVAMLEKLALNPSEHSREQFYGWLSKHDFTICADGDFIAYKGVMLDEAGNHVSINTGPAIVNGEPVNGHVPNPLGAVIEMPRSQVTFNPAIGCSHGLHVGEYAYAHNFARGALLKVKVNPRDVVSVPTDCSQAKVRVCRYLILEQIDAPETKPVDYSSYECDECEYCIDGECTGECEETICNRGCVGECDAADDCCAENGIKPDQRPAAAKPVEPALPPVQTQPARPQGLVGKIADAISKRRP